MDLYTIRVWRGGRLRYAAGDVMATTYGAAKRLGVQAICSRLVDKPEWLMDLYYHVTVPGAGAPDDVAVSVISEKVGAAI